MADDSLLPVLKAIQDTLKEIRADIKDAIRELRKIPKALQEGFTRVQEAVDENTQAQAELVLMEKIASVRTIPPQIEAEQERVADEKRELETKLDSISERFQGRHDELDETAAERIRNVGEHIFEIMEEEYETNIEQPFVDHVTSRWHEMQVVGQEIAAQRSDRLEAELRETEETIDDFMHRREALLSDINRHRAPVDIPSETAEPAQIPYWVVTVDDGEERRQELVLPGRLTESDDEWFGARVESLTGIEPIISQVTEATDPETSVATQATPEEISDAVSEYDRDRLAGQLRFGEELSTVFPESVDIEVESESEREVESEVTEK